MDDGVVGPTDSDELPGRAIDPQLLTLIQRVAHREHLLDGTATTLRSNSQTRPGRRRPATESSARRTTRGTTARKVTWSR
ncbi:hypothetical protein LQ327_03910 [Actinomycetospora endophytica]|uniref:IstB-like ATP binding protein n=1 Tax=Actinomycetospora endophytica TaxID=2291215 RepID=A0ABS8P3C4_9PSEU|nr:hypothetical protein [Actinomycetospora endophytica]MCD2192538.1 hypothetical protein [Actinomycetospora endophytica]